VKRATGEPAVAAELEDFLRRHSGRKARADRIEAV
jgi:hypothetical protein